uniref:Uncharacterized protein n=1 Tax=Percolomonas cosmopolitus TaxID=63605 RepID=A0A7S1PHW8_9EUKA|mmetsp:Transcript_6564/g.24619  ORF Transcript_6564/g.24619 Transcript_6564/m.24619 type:complete len:126 (+) Transcript_6564:49-426(+)|eukprot:CAMPEP_0117439056 /NCGR_PEP_ID=MMETSP0759-20121206/2372_1 /TAXON_ID=63605 /ORGANISM="Percolomonas cosmopolitus, Strain WS" /LENGTH=125 /DNA_ID=CAMNT_0005230767 /DNA_START=36 /DNA_END=413 /DNA_ORIENTATION=+
MTHQQSTDDINRLSEVLQRSTSVQKYLNVQFRREVHEKLKLLKTFLVKEKKHEERLNDEAKESALCQMGFYGVDEMLSVCENVEHDFVDQDVQSDQEEDASVMEVPVPKGIKRIILNIQDNEESD